MLNDTPFTIINIPKVTRGQAETVLYARELIDNDQDLVVYNIDTSFYSKTLPSVLQNEDCKKDGVLGSFQATGTNWSYARLGKFGYVAETAEKIEISRYALTGMYHFTRGEDFVRVALKTIQNEAPPEGEFYIAPLYNQLIAEGMLFRLDQAESFTPLGTPSELKEFRGE